MGPPKGAIMVAIATPAPSRQESAKPEVKPEAEGRTQVATGEADLADTLQQQPRLVIKELDQETPRTLNAGDIIQLDEKEEICVERGGIGLIILLYRVKQDVRLEK